MVNNEAKRLLSNISDMSDLYYVSMMVLYMMKDEKKFSVLAELALLLDKPNFLNLLWYFEGQEIKIPTSEELTETLMIISAYYFYEIKGVEWRKVFDKIGLEYTNPNSAWLNGKLSWLRGKIGEFDIPKELKGLTKR